MQWLVHTLRAHPEIAIFLALSLGYFIGSIKVGSFSLGSVTGVLVAGVIVGQADIAISADVKSVFFLMFLFAVGYSVGPQFFRGLKSDGVPQLVFSVLLCGACLGVAVAAGRILDYKAGETAGLLAGACTISAVLGVATDSINQLGVADAEKKALLDAMPVAYAVTYLFGTAGSAWILAGLGPWLLGGNLVEKCRELEKKMGVEDLPPGVRSAYVRFIARSFKLTTGSMIGKTV